MIVVKPINRCLNTQIIETGQIEVDGYIYSKLDITNLNVQAILCHAVCEIACEIDAQMLYFFLYY